MFMEELSQGYTRCKKNILISIQLSLHLIFKLKELWMAFKCKQSRKRNQDSKFSQRKNTKICLTTFILLLTLRIRELCRKFNLYCSIMKLKELSNFLRGQKFQKIIRLRETDLIQQQMEDKIQGSSNIPIIFRLLWLCKRREPPPSKRALVRRWKLKALWFHFQKPRNTWAALKPY